ncbi:MAG: flavin oxidoreductase [Rhodobacterales bacterium]|nr:MAG: flavin oxidoreductase [Rhodobacterales bacterium]
MTKIFVPDPGDTKPLRAAFGQFGTGVCVVTAEADIGPVGITVNSFSSVSLDPPMVLWCVGKKSDRHDTFCTAQNFAVHICSDAQDDLIMGFARKANAFDLCPGWTRSETGVPLIENCPARFECVLRNTVDAGDHTVILGEVTRVAMGTGTPRLFMASKFGHFVERG